MAGVEQEAVPVEEKHLNGELLLEPEERESAGGAAADENAKKKRKKKKRSKGGAVGTRGPGPGKASLGWGGPAASGKGKVGVAEEGTFPKARRSKSPEYVEA